MHEPCSYALSLICLCIKFKRLCSDLKELGTEIVNYKQKEMTPLTDSENKYYEEQKECYIHQKEFCYHKNEKRKKKKIIQKKLEIIIILQENLEELLIAFVVYIIKYPKNFL